MDGVTGKPLPEGEIARLIGMVDKAEGKAAGTMRRDIVLQVTASQLAADRIGTLVNAVEEAINALGHTHPTWGFGEVKTISHEEYEEPQ